MKTQLDLDNLQSRLRSDDPETLLAALDESIEVFGRISQPAVQAIKHPQVGPFVAERVYSLIARVLEDVENFMESAAGLEEKAYAAALLLFFGSKSGVASLLEAVEQNRPYSAWAAHKLANAGIVEAKDSIVLRLRCTDVHKAEEIESLLAALKKLNGALPQDLENRFLSDETPDEVRGLIQTEWPQRAVGHDVSETSVRA